jgi:hypothetical protein
MYSVQPLWCLKRVTDTATYEPKVEEFDDGEGNMVKVLVDVITTYTPLPKPKLVPLIPRALVLEARAHGEPEDKGVQRAEYLFLALKPTDIIEWFKQAGSRLGMPDAIIGGGYVIAALLAVFLFVQTQQGG